MFTFDIKKHVPAFILRDKNGYALCKAIETGINAMNTIIKDSVALISDVSTMPEWRLDELSMEYDALYDFEGSIEEKRDWITLAMNSQIFLGTPESIVKYLNARYWYVYVNERTIAPFNYDVYVKDDNPSTDTTWAESAAEKAGNVRSIAAIKSGTLDVHVEMEGTVDEVYDNYSDIIYDLRLSNGTKVTKSYSQEWVSHHPIGAVIPDPLIGYDSDGTPYIDFDSITFYGIDGDKDARITRIYLVKSNGTNLTGAVNSIYINMYKKDGETEQFYRDVDLRVYKA